MSIKSETHIYASVFRPKFTLCLLQQLINKNGKTQIRSALANTCHNTPALCIVKVKWLARRVPITLSICDLLQVSSRSMLTPLVQKPGYSEITGPISWTLMPWAHASPSHQQPWHYLCWMIWLLSSARNGFNVLHHLNVKECWTRFIFTFLNSSPPSAAYMRQWIGSALVEVMACRLFGAKPLPQPMLTYC